MFTIQGESMDRFCDHVSRRDLLRVGALGLGFGALNLADLLRAEAKDDIRI